jgi:hypothetical protein
LKQTLIYRIEDFCLLGILLSFGGSYLLPFVLVRVLERVINSGFAISLFRKFFLESPSSGSSFVDQVAFLFLRISTTWPGKI